MTRVACLTPLPPARSGVADYAAGLLEALARRVEVTALAPAPAHPIPGVEVRRPTARELRRLDRHDVVLAQVGNSGLHAWIVDAIRGRPVVVTLHDVVLHHLVAGMTIGRGRSQEYVAAMAAEHGDAGRLLGYGVVSRVFPPLWEVAPDLYPLTGPGVADASLVIVHSAYAAERVREVRPGVPVEVIPLLDPRPAAPAPLPVRRGRRDGFPLIGCFGFLIPAKRLPVVMDAFVRLRARHPSARLLVVGESGAGIDPAAMATAAGVPADAVTIEGYLPRERYDALLRTVDIAVSLRHPTMGESSAAVSQQLALGIPTVVSTGGWYDELPGGAVARIAPGPDEALELSDALIALTGDDDRRARMGAAGWRHARERMSPDAAADHYLRACLAPAGRVTIGADLLASLADGLADVAPAPLRDATGIREHLARAARFTGVL